MADVKWIKVTTDIFDDEKILLIESLPDADAIIVIWFKLLCLAGKTNNSGIFMLNDRIAYTNQMLATIFRRKESVVNMALTTFEQFGMIEIVDDVITIPNWGKHQNLDQLELKRDYMKNYMKEYRAKQQKQISCKTNSKANSKTNVSEAEVDKEVDKDIDKSSTVPTLTDIQSYIQSKHYTFSAERFLEYCNGKGWSNISNWQKYADYWQKLEKSGKKRISDTMSRDEGTIKGYMQDLNDPTA